MMDTAVKVPTFCDEFKPIIKVLNRVLLNKDILDGITIDEYNKIEGWLDDFKSLALEFAE